MVAITNLVASQHALVMQAWQCLIGDERITYVSGPITTGRLWIEAIDSGGDPGAPVIDANCRTLRLAARDIRRQTNALVLEPGSLHVESWSQEDYLALWMTLIERHASRVVFIPDWQFSIGCSLEFERATKSDIPTVTPDGHIISRDTGRSLVERAAGNLIDRSQNLKVIQLAERLADVGLRI